MASICFRLGRVNKRSASTKVRHFHLMVMVDALSLSTLRHCAVLGLTLYLSTANSYAHENKQESFTIGDIKIDLVKSDMNYSGIRYTGKDGQEVTVSVPRVTRAMVAHYSANQNLDEVESEIGAAVVAENKLWFGMSFYGGEGTDGMGGIGFFDPKLKKIGLLRHPVLAYCSAKSIQVTPSEIVVLTHAQGELGEGICNGLVRINRKTLASTIQKPEGKVQAIWDKDGELSNAEKLAGKQYETAGRDLIEHFKAWPSKPGPSYTGKFQEALDSMGFEQFMLEQAKIEYRWIDQAFKHGKVIYDQRCKVDANLVPVCSPPFINRWHCYRGGECDVLRMINAQKSIKTAGGYSCLPSAAWLSLSLLSDNKRSGTGAWQTESFYAPGRTYAPEVDKADISKAVRAARIKTVKPGYQSTFYDYGIGTKNQFSIEAMELTNVACAAPFEDYSGPAIKSLNTRLITTEINQSFVLPEMRKGENN